MIANLSASKLRIFPIVSANVYEVNSENSELIPDQKVAIHILELASQNFSTWQTLTGLGLDSTGKLGHLLFQHKLALQAESSSKWQRADFFWKQVQIEFRALQDDPEFWQEIVLKVANIPGCEIINNPIELRHRLLHELFIDTHCGFYNGLMWNVTKPAWQERAFVHIDYIQHLLELSVVDGEEAKKLLGEAWQTRINACKEAKKWQLAIKYSQQRLKYLPNNIGFQGELAEVHYLKNLAKLQEAKNHAQHIQNAKRLLTGIQILEKYLKDYPYNLTIFQLLGSLYYLQAVSLANHHALAKALLCIQKAITYSPDFLQALKVRNDLIETMNQLQEQVNQFRVDIRHGAQLTPKGHRMVAEANASFAAMNIYIDSDEAKETANDFYIAEAVYLWHKIGLPTPPNGWQKELPANSTSGWTSKALLLRDMVKSALQNPPLTKASLPSFWQWKIYDQPDLAALDTKIICAFLERQMFGEEKERVLITPPTGHFKQPPILAPVSRKPKTSSEPFMSWVFSSQDQRIKVQAIAAIVVAIITGSIIMRERAIFTKRENAYQAILAAKQVQNDEAVLKASKEFFNHTSLLKKDERTAQILAIYEESLVRWFPQQSEGEMQAENNQYLELYKKLYKPTVAN
ncbi:MAG: hypothetical protein KME23_08915 [Goleter apudmare HA4340-LM2]|jgi:tetratricopeptide (TPR) repeat protein|nr:hypothetical protein [Goleter apudmare HA4340-LM2]